MNKSELEDLIKQKFSVRKISNITGKSYTTVRYWIEKYNLNVLTKVDKEKKECPICKETKNISEFYKKGKSKRGSAYCKPCSNTYFSDRWISKKVWAIEYKGSKCVDCNITYPKSPYVIFDFHHVDPSKKDMDWGEMKLRSFNAIKLELDKCIILCSNCHRIRHYKRNL